VGVTDNAWYRFLAERPEISTAEVNFWRPGGNRPLPFSRTIPADSPGAMSSAPARGGTGARLDR
jgi:hypothetical protein